MDIQTRRAIKVDLSSEADFRLGPVLVSPSTRQLTCGKARATLEPRVMQMLVVLAQARGEVVSRDELVLRCWDGVVVGDNAINRVVSLLRAVAAETCNGAFAIETIKKVGYRLNAAATVRSPGLTENDSTVALPRRGVLVGMAVGAVATAGAAFLIWQKGDRPSKAARDLYERGSLAQRQGLLDQTEQAISFFSEAIKIDPRYAAAWGALALSYRHQLVDDPTANPLRLRSLIDGAAGRALALDPDNADAQVAKLLARPVYGRWLDAERDDRALLARYPNHWLLRGSLGRLMYEVGRWSEGVPLFRANVNHDPFLPISRISLGWGLWCLGRIQEAEQVFGEALERWPKHVRIWLGAFTFRALAGNPAAALAMGLKADNWPSVLPRPLIERHLAWARALDSGNDAAKGASIADLRELMVRYPETVPSYAPVLAALGAGDAALMLAGQYFDGTNRGEEPARFARRLAWRETDFLFTPPMARLRSEPHFVRLVEAIGLADYWRRSRSGPDPIGTAQI